MITKQYAPAAYDEYITDEMITYVHSRVGLKGLCLMYDHNQGFDTRIHNRLWFDISETIEDMVEVKMKHEIDLIKLSKRIGELIVLTRS